MASTVQERARFAFYSRKRTEPGLTQDEVARRVGRAVRRTFTQSTAQRWFAGGLPRDTRTGVALANELGVDPGWLYFGGASGAPAPNDWRDANAEDGGAAAVLEGPSGRELALSEARRPSRRRRARGR